MKKKIAFKTLGCRLNQYETDAIASQFIQAGHEVVDFNSPADVYIINTCTVTGQSDQKSRSLMNQARRKGSEPLLVMTGCVVNNHREELEASGKATYVVPNEQKSHIYELIDAHYKGEILPAGSGRDVFGFATASQTLRTRAMLKVQDGCDNFCTFCIIPKVRGRAISRPLPEIIDNALQLLDAGYKELVITGVNIGRYDWEGKRFEHLLNALLELPGDYRVRISSIEPDGFGEGFYELFRHPKLTPHLHLCLQSGSDRVLLKMRRMYTVAEFRQTAQQLRSVVPDFNLTTDIMVGFPGESEEDHLETLKVMREMNFSHVHTFRYSIRKGTRAERMEEQVPEKVKIERSEEVRALAEELKRAYRASFIGRPQRVLTESIGKGYASGFGEYYIPFRLSGHFESNQFVDATPHKLESKADPRLIG
jgi:threonylcarbamoyladenosine tRNA methylthiotransferase MtaB